MCKVVIDDRKKKTNRGIRILRAGYNFKNSGQGESLIKVTFEDPNELTLWMPGEKGYVVWLETHR